MKIPEFAVAETSSARELPVTGMVQILTFISMWLASKSHVKIAHGEAGASPIIRTSHIPSPGAYASKPKSIGERIVSGLIVGDLVIGNVRRYPGIVEPLLAMIE